MILPSDPLERVRTGMQVFDATTREPLGHVVRVQVPVPKVTHPPDSDVIDDMVSLVPAPPDMTEAGAELDLIGTSPVGHDPAQLDDVPEPVRAHLEEVGFIEIDTDTPSAIKGRFIPADRIEQVSDDSVSIRVPRTP